MLTTDDLARLREAVDDAYTWPPSNRDAAIETAQEMLPELLRVYEAVMGDAETVELATAAIVGEWNMHAPDARRIARLVISVVRVPLATAKPTGCGARLAPGQHWAFCGETDMGQTAPALCTNCGGPFNPLATAKGESNG